jgi:DNA-binding transcriptional MocR family regulator
VNIKHTCREGDEVGMEWKGYPRLITFCRTCKVRMQEIPLDDVPERFQGVVHDIIAFMKYRGKGS